MCGEIHALHIHSYPWRSYRDPESGDTKWIRIVVLMCSTAKAYGRQYTKRLLPDFLIPYARIRLDRVMEAAREKEAGADLECCSRIIGCIGLDTARRHLQQFEEAAAEVALLLAEGHAASPHLHENLQEVRPLTILERLEEQYLAEKEMHLRGGTINRLLSLRQLLQTALWKKAGKKSTSCLSRSPPLPCYTF